MALSEEQLRKELKAKRERLQKIYGALLDARMASRDATVELWMKLSSDPVNFGNLETCTEIELIKRIELLDEVQKHFEKALEELREIASAKLSAYEKTREKLRALCRDEPIKAMMEGRQTLAILEEHFIDALYFCASYSRVQKDVGVPNSDFRKEFFLWESNQLKNPKVRKSLSKELLKRHGEGLTGAFKRHIVFTADVRQGLLFRAHQVIPGLYIMASAFEPHIQACIQEKTYIQNPSQEFIETLGVLYDGGGISLQDAVNAAKALEQ